MFMNKIFNRIKSILDNDSRKLRQINKLKQRYLGYNVEDLKLLYIDSEEADDNKQTLLTSSFVIFGLFTSIIGFLIKDLLDKRAKDLIDFDHYTFLLRRDIFFEILFILFFMSFYFDRSSRFSIRKRVINLVLNDKIAVEKRRNERMKLK